MNDINRLIKKPNIPIFLKIWQIIELLGLLFLIPVLFFAGVLLTGDSSKVFNFINSYILPFIGLLLIIKIIVAIAFFKAKRWALYFNFIQSLILSILLLALIVIAILAGAFPTAYIFLLVLFLLISREILKCLRKNNKK